jgi:hypothetical protein
MPSQPPQTRSESGDDPNHAIAGILETLRQSRAILLDPSPRNIDRCSSALASCIQKIGGIIEADRPMCENQLDNRDLRRSLLLVHGELNAITGLLDSAAAFRRDMLKAIAQATPSNVVPIDAVPNRVRHVHVLG